MEKMIAIGDIHGCLEQLEELLEVLSPFSGYPRIFLGDFIDRGPEPGKVLTLVQASGALAIRGNHEERLIETVEAAGTVEEIEALLETARIGKENYEWIKGLPYFYETEDYYFVHAGLDSRKKLSEQTPRDWLYRYDTGDYSHLTKKTVIHGHAITGEILPDTKNIGIDTGCGSGGYLSALVLPEKKVIRSRTKSENWFLRDLMKMLEE